jgi:thiamine monophosphate kinase
VFNSGEEYEIVATTAPKNIPRLEKIAKKCKCDLIQIGYVQGGKGVFMQSSKKLAPVKNKGWRHFT